MLIIRKTKVVGKKKLRSSAKQPSSRLNLLLRKDLKDWAHEYAESRGKSLSCLVADYLYDLREQKKDSDVEQI
jgi:hypothetical protein